jgi:hypothetical protein
MLIVIKYTTKILVGEEPAYHRQAPTRVRWVK